MSDTPFFARSIPGLDVLVAGGSEVVRVWSLRTYELVAEFPSPVEVFLDRLAAGMAGNQLVVVCSQINPRPNRRRLFGLRGDTGQVLWARPELPEALSVRCVESGAVNISYIRHKSCSIDLLTGATLATGPRWTYGASAAKDGMTVAAFDAYGAIVALPEGTRRARIPGTVTAAAAGDPGFIVSASTYDAPGSVRQLSLDGVEAWTTQLRLDTVVTALGYNPRSRLWAGLEHDVHRGPKLAPDALTRWDEQGLVVDRRPTPMWAMDVVIVDDGRLVAMSDVGRSPILLIDTETARPVAELR